MNKKYIVLLCGVAVLSLIAGIALSGGFSCGKDIPAYKIYSYDGSASSMSRLVSAAGEADIVLFGETHNCPVAHWLELELTKALWQKDSSGLVLGAEMFGSFPEIDILCQGSFPEICGDECSAEVCGLCEG